MVAFFERLEKTLRTVMMLTGSRRVSDLRRGTVWQTPEFTAAVDRLIVVSDAKYREFARSFPAHTEKLAVIPEAVSVTRFQPKPKTFSGDIGILCHMKPRKRVYELVLAFHELLQQEIPAYLRNRIEMQDKYLGQIKAELGSQVQAFVPELERDVTGLAMIERLADIMYANGAR